MTHTVQTRSTRSGSARRWLLSALTAIAAIAAALGALLAFGPDDTRISVFWWTGQSGDVSDTLAAWLMVGGGSLLALLAAWGLTEDRSSGWSAALEAALVIGGIAATVLGVTLLI